MSTMVLLHHSFSSHVNLQQQKLLTEGIHCLLHSLQLLGLRNFLLKVEFSLLSLPTRNWRGKQNINNQLQ